MTVIARSITNLSGNKTFSQNISIPNNCTITNNGTILLTGSISGLGGIFHSGTGTTTLNNSTSYSGFTNIRSGTLKIGNSGNLGNGLYNAMMFINGTLDYSGSTDQVVTGNVGNYRFLSTALYNPNSKLIINGPGTFHVRSEFGEFLFDGTLEINGGKFRVGNNDLTPNYEGRTGTGTIAAIRNIVVGQNGVLEFNRNNSAFQTSVNAAITGDGPINIIGGSYAFAGTGDGGAYSGVLSISSGSIWNTSRAMPNASFVNNGTLTLNVGSLWRNNYVFNITDNGNTTNTIYNTDYLVGSSIGAANITAQIQSAGFGDSASEFSGFVPGRIALVQRGGAQNFQTKVNNAITAGAVAVIFYNNTTGISSPTVTTNIPVIMITQSLGQQLVTSLATSTVTSRIDTLAFATTFSNSVTGNGEIIKSGDSPLTVSLGSGFTGIVSITGGVLRVSSSDGFGGASLVRPSANSGAFEILGGLTINKPFSLNGAGISSGGAIRNISGDNTLSGATTLTAASRINSDAGTLTINGNASGAHTLTVGGAGNTTINGVFSVNNLTKDGAGTLELTAVNTYPHGTTISAGTLKLTGGGIAGTSTITNNSSLVIENNEGTTIPNGTAGTGTIVKNLNTRVISTGNLNHTGTTTINAGTLALGSNASVGGSTGNFVVNAGATLEINRSVNSTFSRPFSGAGSLLISSNSTAIFTSNLTHTGGTTVSAGIMSIGSGSTTGSITGDIVNNATVNFNRSDAYTYSGVISGTGNLSKSAAGTLTLTGNNTYSGTTTINGGTLKAGNATCFGTGTITINSGAILDRAGFTITNTIVNNGGTIIN